MQSKQSIYEKVSQKKGTYDGITLSYSGARYTQSSFENNSYMDDGRNLNPFAEFTERFKNLGALLIRFHLGQGQKGGLLQQITRPNYSENPVERPAKGGDDLNVFFENASPSMENILEFVSHLPLGRSKVLNERAQPLIHVNKAITYGEQGMWDIIHAPVWNVGRNLKYELKKQGFIYIPCPQGSSSEKRELIDKIIRFSKKSYVKTLEELNITFGITTFDISQLTYEMDDEKKYSKEHNGLAIGLGDANYAPLGWIVHEQTGDVLPQGITEEIVRVSAIAKGGFYERSKTQQQILQAGFLKNTNGLGLFMQNQAFNAMYVIFDYLQKYNFDPRPLLDISLKLMSKRMDSLVQTDSSVIDDFLTGALQDEMIQPLKVSQPNSKRAPLPLRFTNSFEITSNNLKAIAYAFDLKDDKKQPIFQAYDDVPIISPHSTIVDAKVNGRLIAPSFNTGAHVAAVLSTAELVAEQMILEQLLPEAFKNEQNVTQTILFQILTKTIGPHKGKELIMGLLLEIKSIPQTEGKPVCGVQFEYCNKLVQTLRNGLGFDKLQVIVALLARPGISTFDAFGQLNAKELEGLSQILKTLFITGSILQKSPLTSGQSESSRGINAGLEPLISFFNPTLAFELGIGVSKITHADLAPINKDIVKDRVSTKAFLKCPFLSSIQQKQSQQSESVIIKESLIKNQNTQGTFFNNIWKNKKICSVLLGTGVIIGSYLASNQ